MDAAQAGTSYVAALARLQANFVKLIGQPLEPTTRIAPDYQGSTQLLGFHSNTRVPRNY